MPPCLFCKIVAGDVPSSQVYEDEDLLAFLDINPVQKGHTLLIPKVHSASALDADDRTLALIAPAAKKIALAVIKSVSADGCTISANNGSAAGQEVFHLHWHIIPRFSNAPLSRWPRGVYESSDERQSIAEKIKQSF